jgi:NarL family two-component system response regulator LiaR
MVDGVNLVRVFLIDDHQMLRDALAARLAHAAGLWVVGGASTRDSGLADVVARARPDVVTVELEQAGTGSTALLGRLSDAAPRAHIVVLTGCQDVGRAVDAARAGAIAWVGKESSLEHLIEVLRGAGTGQAWYPGAQLGEVLRALRADVRTARDRTGPLDILSGREREVLNSMVDGKRRTEIAEDLGVSANTVRTHTRSILSKLGVRSSLQAVSVALSSGVWPSERSAGPAIALAHPR